MGKQMKKGDQPTNRCGIPIIQKGKGKRETKKSLARDAIASDRVTDRDWAVTFENEVVKVGDIADRTEIEIVFEKKWQAEKYRDAPFM